MWVHQPQACTQRTQRHCWGPLLGMCIVRPPANVQRPPCLCRPCTKAPTPGKRLSWCRRGMKEQESGTTGGSGGLRPADPQPWQRALYQPTHICSPSPCWSHSNSQLPSGEAGEDNPSPQLGSAPESPVGATLQHELDQGGGCWGGDCGGTCQCLGAISLPVISELPAATSIPSPSAEASSLLPPALFL